MQQRRAVAAAHDHVGDHEVRLQVLGQFQRRLGADRLVDLPAAEPQQRGHAPARAGRVVDDEGGQHGVTPTRTDWAVNDVPVRVVTEIRGFSPRTLLGATKISLVFPVVASV